jgi:hypothetical protein
MKKIISLFSLLFSMSSQAQTWCAPGATWHYELHVNGVGGTIKGSIELMFSDTATVKNKLCKVITGRFWGVHYNMYPPNTPTTNIAWNYAYYTYEDSGVVYIASDEGFDTIVNYNAVPGDKWLTAFGRGCDFDREVLEVTDTGHVTINGNYLKTIEVKVHNPFISYPKLFIERVGNTNGFMYVRAGCFNDDISDGVFTCYSDDNFPLYKRAGVTECYTTVSVDELQLRDLVKVFPNPNSGYFKIEILRAAEVLIHSPAGSLLSRQFFPGEGSFDINIEAYPAGIYFVEVRDGTGRATYKIGKL